ncbi:MAG: ABC-type transport auxiliary lipoprotein family protein [Nitrospirota bacterium]|nr:ABC-type transport auxiliary lipoprotein family protein [Nitrospirota bacterium]MDH5774021.1 ABC-type transport auxiliary lipoprotein family protein [Nitrospirota bacterium]
MNIPKMICMISLCVVGALALTGCLGGQPSPDYFYRLNLADPETRLDPTPFQGTLQVTRPWADALTSERHLVYRKDDNISQLNHHAYHRWVDSPTLLVQQEMTHYLRKAGLAEQVVTPEMRTKADYALSCRIAKLERVLDQTPRVILELELGITSMHDRRTLLLRTYREERPTTDLDIASSIDAYNQALSTILNHFLADASKLSLLKLTNTNM